MTNEIHRLLSEHSSVLQTALEASNIFLNSWPSEDRWGQGRMGSEQGMEKNPEWNWAVWISFSSWEEKVTKNGSWKIIFFLFIETVEPGSQVAWLDYRSFSGGWKASLIFLHLDQSFYMFLFKKEIVASLMLNSPFLYNHPTKASGIICMNACPCFLIPTNSRKVSTKSQEVHSNKEDICILKKHEK